MSLRSVLVVSLLLLVPSAAAADFYSYTDGEGVVHITNIRPRAKRGKWKRVMREAPKGTKAAASRGTCKRCDSVPARDRSRNRLHRYDPFIYEAAAVYRIPVPLIRAVIKVESDYDPRVVSSAGARGLMQLMPAAASDMGVSNPHDPRQCILGGTRLLRVLANRYQGDLVKTIAAYHAGPGSLAKYGDNVPPYKNTRKYLQMVLDRYYQFRDRERRQAKR